MIFIALLSSCVRLQAMVVAGEFVCDNRNLLQKHGRLEISLVRKPGQSGYMGNRVERGEL